MEGVNAQHHQHMFCARLDMAVDDEEGGKGLYVSEVTSLFLNEQSRAQHAVRAVLQEACPLVLSTAPPAPNPPFKHSKRLCCAVL